MMMTTQVGTRLVLRVAKEFGLRVAILGDVPLRDTAFGVGVGGAGGPTRAKAPPRKSKMVRLPSPVDHADAEGDAGDELGQHGEDQEDAQPGEHHVAADHAAAPSTGTALAPVAAVLDAAPGVMRRLGDASSATAADNSHASPAPAPASAKDPPEDPAHVQARISTHTTLRTATSEPSSPQPQNGPAPVQARLSKIASPQPPQSEPVQPARAIQASVTTNGNGHVEHDGPTKPKGTARQVKRKKPVAGQRNDKVVMTNKTIQKTSRSKIGPVAAAKRKLAGAGLGLGTGAGAAGKKKRKRRIAAGLFQSAVNATLSQPDS